MTALAEPAAPPRGSRFRAWAGEERPAGSPGGKADSLSQRMTGMSSMEEQG
jgi:hypothetical protein